jgi:pimeloyl-ACP methyl ester carboxylesterase
MPFLRSLAGVFVGMLAASVLIFAVESAGHALFPLPGDIDTTDLQAIRAAAEAGRIPAAAMAAVLVGWGVGAFAGAWIAAKIAGRMSLIHGSVVGAILLSGSVANLTRIPSPIWMWAGAFVLIPGAVCAAAPAAGEPLPPSPKP